MSIAIINYGKLVSFVTEIGFPVNHRINLTGDGMGHHLFNDFIRKNVEWIQEIDFRKNSHVKVWGSAKLTGPVPNAENYYSRSVMSGTEEDNPFKQFNLPGESPAHANYVGATFALSRKFIADFKETEDGKVDVVDYIRVLIADDAENTYLGYGLEIPVEKLWNIHYVTDDVSRFMVTRTEFGVVDGEYFYVREQTPEEVKERYVFNETRRIWEERRNEPSIVVNDIELSAPTTLELNEFSADV